MCLTLDATIVRTKDSLVLIPPSRQQNTNHCDRSFEFEPSRLCKSDILSTFGEVALVEECYESLEVLMMSSSISYFEWITLDVCYT